MALTTSYSTLYNASGSAIATVPYILSLITQPGPLGQPATTLTSTISTGPALTNAAATTSAVSIGTASSTPVVPADTTSGSAGGTTTTSLRGSSSQPSGTNATATQAVSSSPSIPKVTPHNGLISFTTTIDPTTAGPTTVTFTGRVIQKTTSIGGPLAGIAIGGLVVGIICGILAMLVVRKKKPRRSRSSRVSTYADDSTSHGPVRTVGGGPKEKAVISTTSTDPDYLLPQPRDDQSMGADANKLFVHISNHVENFYHNNSLSENISPQSEEEGLLISRKTRHFAIKRLICREMLAAMAWECKPENSLLPSAAVAMAHNMSQGNLDQSSKSCNPHSSEPALTTVAYEVAWSRWRVSTALLLAKDDGLQKAQARKYWVDRLQQKLQPFQVADAGTSATIIEDLYAICKLAESLASLICSQPGRWEFVWPRSDAREQMVIFPEFVRTTDGKGRGLERPKRALDAKRMQ